jgi:hypothetical protein
MKKRGSVDKKKKPNLRKLGVEAIDEEKKAWRTTEASVERERELKEGKKQSEIGMGESMTNLSEDWMRAGSARDSRAASIWKTMEGWLEPWGKIRAEKGKKRGTTSTPNGRKSG